MPVFQPPCAASCVHCINITGSPVLFRCFHFLLQSIFGRLCSSFCRVRSRFCRVCPPSFLLVRCFSRICPSAFNINDASRVHGKKSKRQTISCCRERATCECVLPLNHYRRITPRGHNSSTMVSNLEGAEFFNCSFWTLASSRCLRGVLFNSWLRRDRGVCPRTKTSIILQTPSQVRDNILVPPSFCPPSFPLRTLYSQRTCVSSIR